MEIIIVSLFTILITCLMIGFFSTHRWCKHCNRFHKIKFIHLKEYDCYIYKCECKKSGKILYYETYFDD